METRVDASVVHDVPASLLEVLEQADDSLPGGGGGLPGHGLLLGQGHGLVDINKRQHHQQPGQGRTDKAQDGHASLFSPG